MSISFHNASIQAQATRDAAGRQIRYAELLRKNSVDKLAKCIEDFAQLDESSLFRKSDKDLALFQAEYPPEAPQYALALNEWNRRLVTRQVKEARFSAFIGLVGIIIGTVLGWFLAAYPAPRLGIYHSEQKEPSSQRLEAMPTNPKR